MAGVLDTVDQRTQLVGGKPVGAFAVPFGWQTGLWHQRV